MNNKVKKEKEEEEEEEEEYNNNENYENYENYNMNEIENQIYNYSYDNNNNNESGIAWIKVLDEISNMYYYFNNYTGESTWEKPLDFIETEGEQYQYQYQQQQQQQQQEQYNSSQTNNQQEKHNFDMNEWIKEYDVWNYQNVMNNQNNNNENQLTASEVDGNGSDTDDDVLPKKTNLLNNAYGTLYDSHNLIIDEKTLQLNKFMNMKKGGTLVRTRLGWEEWLSAQGALFYIKKDGSNGQWEPPEIFDRLETESKIAKNIANSRLQKQEYQNEEGKKVNAYKMLLEEFEMKRHDGFMNSEDSFHQLDTVINSEIIEQVYNDRLSQQQLQQYQQSQSPNKKSVHFNKKEIEITPDFMQRMEEKIEQDEYGDNLKISAHYNKEDNLNQITAGMKEIYKALRTKDTMIDQNIDVKMLENRSEKVKQRWVQYLEVKNERNQLIENNLRYQHDDFDSVFDPNNNQHQSDSDEDNDRDTKKSFDRLTLNSIIIAQKWPWTQLVDLTTDRKFYRNEIEQTYQFDTPKEYRQDNDNGNSNGNGNSNSNTNKSTNHTLSPNKDDNNGFVAHKRRLGVVQSTQSSGQQKNKNNLRNGGTYLSSINLDNNIYLREKYNDELNQRREFFTKNNPYNKQKRNSSYNNNHNNHNNNNNYNNNNQDDQTIGSSYLDEYQPPSNAPIQTINNPKYWIELHNVQTKIKSDLSSPWYDGHVLLQRLRRLDDMKLFLEHYKNLQKRNNELNKFPSINQSSSSILGSANGYGNTTFGSGSGLISARGQSARGNLKEGEDFDYGNSIGVSSGFVFGTKSSFRFHDKAKNTKQSLNEVERIASMKRQAAHRAKLKLTQLKSSISSFSNNMDPLLFQYNTLDKKITQRHLLEACVHFKSTLLKPIQKHEIKAYPGLNLFEISPNTLKLEELQQITPQEVISLPYWNIHLINKNSLVSTQKEMNDEDIIILYSTKFKKLQNIIQYGIPFDVKYHKWNQKLDVLRVYEYQTIKSSLESKGNHIHKTLEFISDELKGFLYFCLKRDIYHWNTNIYLNYYESIKYNRLSLKPHPPSRKGYDKYEVDDDYLEDNFNNKVNFHNLNLNNNNNNNNTNNFSENNSDNKIGKKRLKYLEERLNDNLKKINFSYRPLSLIENRTQNIWSDLEMTKLNPDNQANNLLLGNNTYSLMRAIVEEESDYNTNTSNNYNLNTIGNGNDNNNHNNNNHNNNNNSNNNSVDNNNLIETDVSPLNIQLINRHNNQNPYYSIYKQFINCIKSSEIQPTFVIKSTEHITRRITSTDLPDIDPLFYELEFSQNDYLTYNDLILDLVETPTSVPALLSLTEFLLTKKLGRESLMVLIRIIEISTDKTFNTTEEYCLIILYSLYLFIKFSPYFSILSIIKSVLVLCPTNPTVLTISARLYHLLHQYEKSEEIYIGALIIDPLHSSALYGYSLLLIDRGDYSLACRYLNRIQTDYSFYSQTRLLYVWIQEIIGNHTNNNNNNNNTNQNNNQNNNNSKNGNNGTSSLDSLLLQYQQILPYCGNNNNNSNNTSSSNKNVFSLTLTSIGHFYHIYQNNLGKAIEFYERALKVQQKNGYIYGMYACALGSLIDNNTSITKIHIVNTLKGQKKDSYLSTISSTTGRNVKNTSNYISRPGLETEIEVNNKDELIDANFRRSIFFMKGKNKWIILLAYGEFVVNRLQDMFRGEEILWEAARISSPFSPWSIIALTHFYQYTIDNSKQARRVLVWASRQREIPIGNHHNKYDKNNFDNDENENNDIPETDQDDPSKSFSNSDNAAICITQAYLHFQNKEFTDAIKYCRTSLKYDPKYAPAWRCIALIEWYQGARDDSIIHFKKSLNLFPMNPYCLKSAAIVNAIMGNYQEAVHMIQASVDIGGNISSLTWRAAGQITYLYEKQPNSKQKAIYYLQKAFELSKNLDFEAGRLLAQIQMELGQFQEAMIMLKTILPLKPCDSIGLASLALCLSALGYNSNPSLTSVNYALKIKLMDDSNEFVNSTDPIELFEAATIFNLKNLFLQKSGNKKSSYLDKGWSIINNTGVSDLDQFESHDSDVPPIVLYWYGMFCLQKGGNEMLKKAKGLFDRATQRADYPPHLLALHKLGWLAETRRDLRTAERYYCYAIQMEPIDPLLFLQLYQTIHDTHKYIQLLLEDKSIIKSQSPKKDINNNMNETNNLPSLVDKKKKKKKKKLISDDGIGVSVNEDDHALDQVTLQKRCILHNRVEKFCELRYNKLRNQFESLETPGKFIYYDIFWLENYLDCFVECEDWTWLMRCGQQFRSKVGVK